MTKAHSASSSPRQAAKSNDGMVTAEAALTLPLIGLFVLALCWLLSLGIAEVRLVDGARDAARDLARGDDRSEAVAAARRSAGDNARVTVISHGALVTVHVARELDPPRWLLVPLPSVTVHADSTVMVEDDTG